MQAMQDRVLDVAMMLSIRGLGGGRGDRVMKRDVNTSHIERG